MSTDDRYGSASIGMHWLMLLLMVGVYAAINLHDLAPTGSALRVDLKTGHFVLGMGDFAPVEVRFVTRPLSWPAPRIEPEQSVWQRRLGEWIHIALYVVMVDMPVSRSAPWETLYRWSGCPCQR